MKRIRTGHLIVASLVFALLASGCGSATTTDPLASEEVATTREVLRGRFNGTSFDELPNALGGLATETSRIVIGEVIDLQPGMAFIDIDEATLSESAAGEATVLDELPEPQSREIRSLLEQGELPPPVAVDFDSPLASWRTVELIVQATDEVSDRGLVELEEHISVRVSFPPTIGIESLEGYRTIGRAAFFVDSSAVFDGAEGIQLDGQLVGVLSEADEIISMPFLEDELADQWLEENPTIASLTEARLSAAS